jgi:hypothetical protein
MNAPIYDMNCANVPTDRGNSQISIDEKKRYLETNVEHPGSMRKPGEGPPLDELLRWLTRSFVILALMSSFALLCVGATPFLTPLSAHLARAFADAWDLVKGVPLSAIPLLLAGVSYIVLQAIVRPQPLELFKRLMLGSAFLLWGVVQLLPVGNFSNELGNVVIALYVIDLGLIVWTELEKEDPRIVQ